jgi:diacylglycerol kinase
MRLLNAFKHAFAGIRSFFTTEQNGRTQGVVAILVIVFSISLQIDPFEWMLVLGCIALVVCLEMLNSAIEKICNLITTNYNPEIKVIKDIGAGAVLVAAIISTVIGTMIFLPRILQFIN